MKMDEKYYDNLVDSILKKYENIIEKGTGYYHNLKLNIKTRLKEVNKDTRYQAISKVYSCVQEIQNIG